MRPRKPDFSALRCTLPGRIFIPLLLFSLLFGCRSGPSGERAPTDLVALNIAYTEHHHDGVIYLTADEETAKAVAQTKQLSPAKVMDEAGPKGEQVLIQRDPERPELEEALWQHFQQLHLYYREERQGNTIFLLGTQLSYMNYLRERSLPGAELRKKAGAQGEDVYIEQDEERPELRERLWRTYQQGLKGTRY